MADPNAPDPIAALLDRAIDLCNAIGYADISSDDRGDRWMTIYAQHSGPTPPPGTPHADIRSSWTDDNRPVWNISLYDGHSLRHIAYTQIPRRNNDSAKD